VAIGNLLLGASSLSHLKNDISWAKIDRGDEIRAIVVNNSTGWFLTAGVFLLVTVTVFFRPSLIDWLRLRLLSGHFTTVAACLFTALLIIWAQNSTACRRLSLAMFLVGCGIEFAPEGLALMRRTCESYYGKIATVFVLLSLFTKVLPGTFFYPFSPGIAGWKFQYKETDVVVVSGLQMIRDDGEAIWFDSDLLLPQPIGSRQILYHEKDEHRLKLLLDFYCEIYVRQFPHLEQGRHLHQRYLGSLAFPGHMPGRMLAYEAFPPDRIIGFRSATEIFNKSADELTERRISWEYRLADRSLKR